MGFISRTVASNNLTVAIKDLAGANFSASNPMVHKIGAAPRSLAGALSVTVNAGTNTFNAGGAELATKEIDYFVYLGWRAASSTVFILISRIPYARVYGDFSSTATNELYGAYSGSAPASTDEVVNIGRVNATLSAGAGYTWSVPATSIIINHPIYETRWLTYTPTITYSGGTTNPTSNVIAHALYQVSGRNIHTHIESTLTIGGGNRTQTAYSRAITANTYITAARGMGSITGTTKMPVAIFTFTDGLIYYQDTMSASGSIYIYANDPLAI